MNSMKLKVALVIGAFPLLASTASALGSECPGNPDALGTSRLIQVNPSDLPGVGQWDYPDTLPLEDHEVVITFDDGPMRRKTERVLDVLKRECVRATFFVLGRMVR